MKYRFLQKPIAWISAFLMLLTVMPAMADECLHEVCKPYVLDVNTGLTDTQNHKCENCGAILPHQYQNGVCTVCGYACQHDVMIDFGEQHKCACGNIAQAHSYVPYIPDPDLHACVCGRTESHVWDDGVITTPATCVAEGVRTFTCSVCGEQRTDAIAATGVHSWDDGVITTPATCDQTGVKLSLIHI